MPHSALAYWKGGAFGWPRAEYCCRQHWPHCSTGIGESHFLQLCSQRGLPACAGDLYSRLFDAGAATALDCTPAMLADPYAAELLRAIYPERLAASARFIAVLREPAARMLSWYNQRRGRAFSSAQRVGGASQLGSTRRTPLEEATVTRPAPFVARTVQ